VGGEEWEGGGEGGRYLMRMVEKTLFSSRSPLANGPNHSSTALNRSSVTIGSLSDVCNREVVQHLVVAARKVGEGRGGVLGMRTM
jgi:hypothetical protein